jgi:hypothetical protein
LRPGPTTSGIGRNTVTVASFLSSPGPFEEVVPVVAHIDLGEHLQALSLLEDALAQHSPSLVALGVDPIYDPLREEPRFQTILDAVGLRAVAAGPGLAARPASERRQPALPDER